TMSGLKKAEELTVEDLKAYAVWEFTNSDEDVGETVVRPVKKTPVNTLGGRVVGVQVTLANSSARWALIGNIDAHDARLTQHFLSLVVFDGVKFFTMVVYFDFKSETRGPRALADFLQLAVDAVFPISYDVSRHCVGEPAALIGKIEKEPRQKLTRAEL